MYHRRRPSPAAEAARERRVREDAAQRLHDVCPTLDVLHLEISEQRGGRDIVEARYVRRVVVENAAALFELRCMEERCEGGGHDITNGLLRALRAGQERFVLEDACRGTVGSAECGRTLVAVCIAKYRGQA